MSDKSNPHNYRWHGNCLGWTAWLAWTLQNSLQYKCLVSERQHNDCLRFRNGSALTAWLWNTGWSVWRNIGILMVQGIPACQLTPRSRATWALADPSPSLYITETSTHTSAAHTILCHSTTTHVLILMADFTSNRAARLQGVVWSRGRGMVAITRLPSEEAHEYTSFLTAFTLWRKSSKTSS